MINSAANATASSAFDTYTVPAISAGTYTVIVKDSFNNRVGGTYVLDLLSVPAAVAVDADGDGGTIAGGQTRLGTINRYGDLDAYTFSASAGDVFTATLADASPASAANRYAPYLQVIGPSGTRVANSSSYGETGTSVYATYTVPTNAAGTYTIVVKDGNSNAKGGLYSLQLTGTLHPITPTLTLTAPAAQTAVAGTAKSFALGSFAANNTTGPYTVTVHWGDGTAATTFATTTLGTIAAQSHTYAKAATDTVTATVADANGVTSNAATFAVTVSAAATAKLTLTPPANQTAVAGVAKAVALGSFTATGTTGPYTVNVYWGDGSTHTTFTTSTLGTLAAQSHTFAKAAADTVSVTVTDAKGVVSNTATFAVAVSAAATGSISGTVFNDANGDGKLDGTDLGLGLYQVFIDADKDGKLDAGEAVATTDADGNFTFASVAAGTYTVRVVQRGTSVATSPTGGVRSVVVAAGAATSGVLFGEKRAGG